VEPALPSSCCGERFPAIIAHDALDKPAIIVMDGNGIGRGPYQDLWAKGFRHLLPGESMASSASDNLKIRRFNEGLFNLYDGLVRLPNAMPRLDALLAEIAAFPDGKHDDQVDALSYVAAYSRRVIHEARRWGVELGRLKPPSVKVQVIPPKSPDQELYERRRCAIGKATFMGQFFVVAAAIRVSGLTARGVSRPTRPTIVRSRARPSPESG
jgi:hypothetical protein